MAQPMISTTTAVAIVLVWLLRSSVTTSFVLVSPFKGSTRGASRDAFHAAQAQSFHLEFRRRSRLVPRHTLVSLNGAAGDETNELSGSSPRWTPRLRHSMAWLAAAGLMETSYLVYADVTRTTQSILCVAASTSTSCSSVLQGPYAHVPGTPVPLAALGVVAYATVLALSLVPLQTSAVSNQNQMAVTAIASSMAVGSVCLLGILVGILHESCIYCLASAALSLTLASVAWWGRRTTGTNAIPAGASLATLVAAAVLVTSVTVDPVAANVAATPANVVRKETSLWASSTTSALAAAAAAQSNSESKAQPVIDVLQSPPAITTTSSDAALRLAKELQALDATFYGAFWCGHCYDQKQAFGAQAMARIPYVECSKEGVHAQVALCKEKKIPGYPTWEIAGKLYPGEQALDELQEIVVQAKAAAKTAAKAADAPVTVANML